MTGTKALKAPSRAWSDFADAFRQSHVWINLAFNDLRVRYRRSVIGPWWITIQTAVTLFFIGFVYSQLFNVTLSEYLPYLGIGIILWYFTAAMLSEGCSALVEAAPLLQRLRVPIPSIFFRVFLRNFLVFLHNALLLIIVLAAFGGPPLSAAVWCIPGFILLIANLTWMGFTLGVLGLRFRDIQQILVAVLNLLLLLTPIFWNAARLPNRIAFVEFNPFYHLLQIVRLPLLGDVPAVHHWMWAISLALIGWALTLGIYRATHQRLIFWV